MTSEYNAWFQIGYFCYKAYLLLGQFINLNKVCRWDSYNVSTSILRICHLCYGYEVVSSFLGKHMWKYLELMRYHVCNLFSSAPEKKLCVWVCVWVWVLKREWGKKKDWQSKCYKILTTGESEYSIYKSSLANFL